MSYIDRTLGKNETVLYRAQIHSIFYIRVWVLFMILSAWAGGLPERIVETRAASRVLFGGG